VNTNEENDAKEKRTAAELALERALRHLVREENPLSSEELVTLRDMLADYRYRQKRLSERKRIWPVVTLIVSVAIPLVSWLWSLVSASFTK
jgi:hypothetical protein